MIVAHVLSKVFLNEYTLSKVLLIYHAYTKGSFQDLKHRSFRCQGDASDAPSLWSLAAENDEGKLRLGELLEAKKEVGAGSLAGPKGLDRHIRRRCRCEKWYPKKPW